MHAWELNPHLIHVPVAQHLNHWATKPSYVVEFINLNTHYRSPDLLSLSFEFSSESNLSPSLPWNTQQSRQPHFDHHHHHHLFNQHHHHFDSRERKRREMTTMTTRGRDADVSRPMYVFSIHFLIILLTIIYRYDVYDNDNTGTTTTTSTTSSTTSTGMMTTSICVSAPCTFFLFFFYLFY